MSHQTSFWSFLDYFGSFSSSFKSLISRFCQRLVIWWILQILINEIAWAIFRRREALYPWRTCISWSFGNNLLQSVFLDWHLLDLLQTLLVSGWNYFYGTFVDQLYLRAAVYHDVVLSIFVLLMQNKSVKFLINLKLHNYYKPWLARMPIIKYKKYNVYY